MPERDVAFISDLIYCRYATIIAQSAFAAFDGESRVKGRGDKKLYDSIPALPSCLSMATPFCGWGDDGNKNAKDVPLVVPGRPSSPPTGY